MKIQNTENLGVNALKVLIYGASGTGKTTLAGTLSESTLIVSAEAGLLSIANKKMDVIDITTDDSGTLLPKEKRIGRLGEVYKFLNEAETQKKYRTVFIDSLTEIGQNMLEQLQTEFPDAKDTLRLYGENSKRMRSLIKSFRDLPNYNVIFTCLSLEDKDENNRRIISTDLVGKMTQQIYGYFDEVFYLYVSKDEQGNFNRHLLTNSQETVIAKDRSGRLDRIELPNLGRVFEKIRSVKAEQKVIELKNEKQNETKTEIKKEKVNAK